MSPSDNTSGNDAPFVLIYDGECPFCSNYVHMLRLREAAGTPVLVNARDGGEHVEEAKRRGYDLDEGMVLHYGGNWYHGADCMHILALLTARKGINRLWAWVFRSNRRASILYPVLRFGRNTTLRALGRRKIHS